MVRTQSTLAHLQAMYGLAGSLPDTLQYLTSLEVLTMQLNALSGTLPSSMSRLTRLRVLDLGGGCVCWTWAATA